MRIRYPKSEPFLTPVTISARPATHCPRTFYNFTPPDALLNLRRPKDAYILQYILGRRGSPNNPVNLTNQDSHHFPGE